MFNKTISTIIALGDVIRDLCLDPLDCNPFGDMFKEEEIDTNFFASVDNRLVMSITQHESPDMSDVILKMTKFGYKVIGESGCFKVTYGEDDTNTNIMEEGWAKQLLKAFPNPHMRHFGEVELGDVLPDGVLRSMMFMTNSGFVLTMSEISFGDPDKNEDTVLSKEEMLSIITGEALRQKLSEHISKHPEIRGRLREFA